MNQAAARFLTGAARCDASQTTSEVVLRDRRFIAVHRGGPLDMTSHRLLAAWAADCAQRVLHLFESVATDDGPLCAIETARTWSRGEVSVGTAQKAAVATAHMADHSMGAAIYAIKALTAAGQPVEEEKQWQLNHLPESLRTEMLSALELRLGAWL